MHGSSEAVEIVCPNCKHTQIIYLPQETMPKCPKCGTRMVIRELLKEGKSQ
jgi:ribosomal protein S27E